MGGATTGRDVRRWRAGWWSAALLGLLGVAVPLLAAAGAGRVTPATGPSLLTRLKTGFDQSSFGRAGYVGASPAAPEAEPAASTPGGWLQDGFELSGEDLYRINCRSCHGIGAAGLKPITPSIVGRVREGAAEGEDVGTRRRRAGAEMAIRHRLDQGGAVMPPFVHLEPAEVEALIAYLEAIAGVAEPNAPAPRVRVPALAVGEHVVKAVCQTCHDAVPGLRRVAGQAISPALSEIPERWSVGELVEAVRAGAMPAKPGAAHRPRLGYLRPDEVRAAYVYLVAVPPEPGTE
jgi:mono/diheme cytochrome c family protein